MVPDERGITNPLLNLYGAESEMVNKTSHSWTLNRKEGTYLLSREEEAYIRGHTKDDFISYFSDFVDNYFHSQLKNVE